MGWREGRRDDPHFRRDPQQARAADHLRAHCGQRRCLPVRVAAGRKGQLVAHGLWSGAGLHHRSGQPPARFPDPVYLHVPSRRLDAHHRQHAVPLDLRR